jgi:hypothetical protein
MKKWLIRALALVALMLSAPLLLRRNTIPLVSNGQVVATAKRPPLLAWRDNQVDVCVGASTIFSLLGDIWSFPLFIYPFPDAQRFLCIYDDDTSVPVFVVDLRARATNTTHSPPWPINDYTRKCLERSATNIVVIGTKGSVRLPSREELREASTVLAGLTPRRLRTASFPCADFGVYCFYWDKEGLLSALHTNRQGVWPP